MADAPCSSCDTGYGGRAFIAYVNYYDGDELVQCRLRLCQNCIADHFLILVENADRRNERNVWISAREKNGWRTDAPSAITETAQLARNLLAPTSQTMLTSTVDVDAQRTSSVTTAGPLPASQQPKSSKPSKTQDSISEIQPQKSSTSETTSESRSNSRSTQSRPRVTKSTGS